MKLYILNGVRKATVEKNARFFRIVVPIERPIEVEELGRSGQLPVVSLSKVKLI